MEEERTRRRGGVIGPAILIGLGILFLLSNLGILDWSIWSTLLRLWPVLIIAVGLDILLGHRSTWGALLTLILTVAIIVGAVWLLQPGVLPERDVAGEEIAQPLEGAEEARVFLEPGIGTLNLEAFPESSPNLIAGTIEVQDEEDIERQYEVEGERGAFTLRSSGGFVPIFVVAERRVWDLDLNRDVPLELVVDLGAGELDLDLSGLSLNELEIDMGIGAVTVLLPETGRIHATVNGAIGELVVILPEGIPARIQLDTGLVDNDLPAGFVCEEDVCTSADYQGADSYVDLEIDHGIGSVVIRRP